MIAFFAWNARRPFCGNAVRLAEWTAFQFQKRSCDITSGGGGTLLDESEDDESDNDEIAEGGKVYNIATMNWKVNNILDEEIVIYHYNLSVIHWLSLRNIHQSIKIWEMKSI